MACLLNAVPGGFVLAEPSSGFDIAMRTRATIGERRRESPAGAFSHAYDHYVLDADMIPAVRLQGYMYLWRESARRGHPRELLLGGQVAEHHRKFPLK
eukprot:1052881-Pyramimonas_sp.AAC.2